MLCGTGVVSEHFLSRDFSFRTSRVRSGCTLLSLFHFHVARLETH